MVWYSHLLKNFPQFVVIHAVKGFSIVNEAVVDVFLEFPCFLYDPLDVADNTAAAALLVQAQGGRLQIHHAVGIHVKEFLIC